METTTNRIWTLCPACGALSYRIPGKRHGDGQQDSDATPVWLLDCDSTDARMPSRLEGLERSGVEVQRVNCGCTE